MACRIGDHGHETRGPRVRLRRRVTKSALFRRPRRDTNRTSVLSCRPAPRRPVAWPIPPTPSCTATATSRSSTGPRPRTTSSRGPWSSAWPASPSRTTRACTARSASRPPRRRPGCVPVIGIEIELVDAAAPDPGGIVVPARRAWRPGRRPPVVTEPPVDRRRAARPAPPDPHPAAGPSRGREGGPPGDRRGAARAAPRCCSPGTRRAGGACAGWCRGRTSPGRRRSRKFTQALLAEHAEGLIALSGCREGELARRLRAGDREGARAVAERYAALFGHGTAGCAASRPRGAASCSSCPTTSCPTTTGSSRRRRAWPRSWGCRWS